jgi:hypothetical protein
MRVRFIISSSHISSSYAKTRRSIIEPRLNICEIFQSAALVCRDAASHSQPTTLGTQNVWGAVIAVLS